MSFGIDGENGPLRSNEKIGARRVWTTAFQTTSA
jgi:hypothetical protein